MNLIKVACFPRITKDYMLETTLEDGIEADSGWKFPNVSNAVNRAYIAGRKPIPQKTAEDILNHFVNSKNFIDEYDNRLELAGSRNRIIGELESIGIKNLNCNNISEYLFFLFRTFLQAFEIGTDRITTGYPRDEFETELLEEVNYHCPICNKEMVVKLNNTYMAENYDVYNIFPRNQAFVTTDKGETIIRSSCMDKSSENNIVLCKSHRKNYIEMETKYPDKYYKELKDFNDKIMLNLGGLTKSEATESIARIIELIQEPSEQEEKETRIVPLVLKRKIDTKKENMLYQHIKLEASLYYGLIRKQMSMLDDGSKSIWKRLSSHISDFYKKNSNLPPSTIYSFVTERILKLSTVEQTEKNRMACGYITSFFIQNCEVFDEITK